MQWLQKPGYQKKPTGNKTKPTRNNQDHKTLQRGTQGTRWEGETDAPETSALSRSPQRKSFFPSNLPFCTPIARLIIQVQKIHISFHKCPVATSKLHPQTTQKISHQPILLPAVIDLVPYLTIESRHPRARYLILHGFISHICQHFAPVYPLLSATLCS